MGIEMQKLNSNLNDKLRLLSDDDWYSILIKSVESRRVGDIKLPGFPPPEVQKRFVGSSYQTTLQEAFTYYKHVKHHAALMRKPLGPSTRLLDFGCGWGRFLRFFMKDVKHSNLYGCDPLSEAIEICKNTEVPGIVALTEPEGKLPYPDRFFDVIIAYSVFTHLPERINLHWMRELARVSRPGCVFCLTLEPRGFIDRIVREPKNTDNAWLLGLAKYAPMADELYRDFDSGRVIYLPTGGGDSLTSNVYGDAAVPLTFIKKKWTPYFKVKSYEDFPKEYWMQARLVVQRRSYLNMLPVLSRINLDK